MDRTRCCTSFSKIQSIALWAGALGLIQSLCWIGLSIVSILAYCCIIGIDSLVSYGSITKFVFFKLYFKGDCLPDPYPEVDYSVLQTTNTIFGPEQVLIWTCVYLGVSVIWLVSSCLLLTHVRKNNVKVTGAVLYTWATIVLIVCCMDLSIGVIFGVDYGRFQSKAYDYNLASYQSGTIYADAVQLISAQIAAISMMIISFKGFVLWLINLGLMIYIFIAAFMVQNAILRENEFINNTFNSKTNTVLATREPIKAYESKNEVVFENAGFIVEERTKTEAVELNQESINRAARMSTDNLQERRFRNIDSFQQYPPPRQQQQQQQPQQAPQFQLPPLNNDPPFPAPDYTPPMPRANQNGQVRNNRYQ